MHYFGINFLECFGASQCIKYVCAFITGQRLLSISNSTNALSWLDSNKFDLSRRTGKCVSERNKITDSFSHDTRLNFEQLIYVVQQHEETQNMMPEKVIVLEENREEIFSWLQSKEQIKPKNQQKGKRWSRSTGLFTGNRWLKFC